MHAVVKLRSMMQSSGTDKGWEYKRQKLIILEGWIWSLLNMVATKSDHKLKLLFLLSYHNCGFAISMHEVPH